MTLRAILLCLFTLTLYNKAEAIQATTTTTLFYKKSKKDSSHYNANIVLSWRVQNSTLHFKKNTAGQYESGLVCLIRWSTDTGMYKEETFVIKTPPQSTPEEAYAQIITDQYDYTLPAGHYNLEMALFEQDHKDQLYQYNDTLTVKEAPKDQSFLSGIQILDTSYSIVTQTVYTRNGKLDFPLASNYINEQREHISLYYELYQANKTKQTVGPLKLNCYISWKPFSSPVPQMQHNDSVIQETSFQYFYTSFPLQSLPSGNYYLNITISDKYDFVIDKNCLFIQRYNPNPKIVPKEITDSVKKTKDTTAEAHILDLTTTFIGKYNASQVHAILKMMLLICDPNEGISINGFLRKPDELYSKYFIYNFWEKRDKQNPEKVWKAFAERIKEVNRLFRAGSQSGYETDRGRIYIQYGKPNDRMIVNNETGTLPYEIWQYYNTEKQGREGVFLFYKPGKSFGEYELIHSTLVGEKRNTNWRSLLYNNSITGSGGLNSDSRAEQYIGNK